MEAWLSHPFSGLCMGTTLPPPRSQVLQSLFAFCDRFFLSPLSFPRGCFFVPSCACQHLCVCVSACACESALVCVCVCVSACVCVVLLSSLALHSLPHPCPAEQDAALHSVPGTGEPSLAVEAQAAGGLREQPQVGRNPPLLSDSHPLAAPSSTCPIFYGLWILITTPPKDMLSLSLLPG